MERTAIQKQLTSPYGTFEWNDNYGLFTPYDGAIIPVLVHIDYKDVEPRLIKQLAAYLANHASVPPIILFTYGDAFHNVAGLCAKWKREDFQENFKAIFSIAYTKLGWTQGYSSRFDNLPGDLDDALRTIYGGKVVGYGSKIAEALGSVLDKPAVSMNLPCLGLDLLKFISFVDYLPKIPENYTYVSYINTPSIVPKKEDMCGCCGKRRGPLLAFDKLPSKICSACERKIKKKGPMSLQGLLDVQYDLEQEKSVTRQANYLKQVKEAGMYKCPACESILTQCEGNEYTCTCGSKYFVVGKRIIEVRTILNKRYAYSFSVKPKGKKLLKAEPIEADTSPVAECYICKRLITHWQWWKDSKEEIHQVCGACICTSSNNFFTRKEQVR